MEIVAITTVVVILQIITLALLRGTRKQIRELVEAQKASPAPYNRDRNQNRRDKDTRSNRRPQQDSRQKTPLSAKIAPKENESAEKSLRDINLKLKNAERDQNDARRKIQENIGKEQPRREGSRGGRDSNRGARRGNTRGNWRERGRADGSQGDSQKSQEASDSGPVVQNETVDKTATPQVIEPVVKDIPRADVPQENLQHGRKVVVKRRMLNDEDSATAGSSGAGNDISSSDATSVEKESFETGNDTKKLEIKFGRR